MAAEELPVIEVSGTYREVGIQIGSRLRSMIQRGLETGSFTVIIVDRL